MAERIRPEPPEQENETTYKSSSERLQLSIFGRFVRFLKFINDLLR